MIDFREILKELEYRSSKIVNLKDPNQIYILSEILEESDVRYVKNEIINNLLHEKGETPRDSKEVEREKSEDDKYMHTSNNVYIKKQDAAKYKADNDDPSIDKFKKDEDGNYRKIAADAVVDKTGGTDVNKTDVGVRDKEGEQGEAEAEEQERQNAIQNTFSDTDYQQRIKDEAEAAKEDTAKKQQSKKSTPFATVAETPNFSKKSEATEGLFAGQDNYKTIDTGKKQAVVRPMIDPDTGQPLDTSQPKDRERAIIILDRRLKSLDKKVVQGIKMLEEGNIPNNDRRAILKWLGEVGELQCYSSLLKSNKIHDVYMYTDSEPKNDLVVVGKTDKRNIFLKGISVKTAEMNTMANKRGSSVKPDFENAIENAETRKIKLDGVTRDVDASVVMNSMLELRKRLIKEVSMGRVRQNPQTKESEVMTDDGNLVSIAEYLRYAKIPPTAIDKVFGDDTIFRGKNNPIRSLSGEEVENDQMLELRDYFKKMFKDMVGNEGLTIKDMQDNIVNRYIGIYDKIGANLTPATDMIISYFESNGFADNKMIPREDF